MNKYLIVFLCLFLMACGSKPRIESAKIIISPELSTFYEDFIQSGYGIHFPSSYLSLTAQNIDGVGGIASGCLLARSINDKEIKSVSAVITVDIIDLGWMSNIEKWGLVWHELGHCLLWREHNVDLLKPGYPESLMWPYVLSEWMLSLHEEHYRMEMFSNVSNDMDWSEVVSFLSLENNDTIETSWTHLIHKK